MFLADYQGKETIFVICTEKDLFKLPLPSHITDMQTGELLAEFPKNNITLVMLELAGLTTTSLSLALEAVHGASLVH